MKYMNLFLLFLFTLILSSFVSSEESNFKAEQKILIVKFVDSLTLEPLVNSTIEIHPEYADINFYGEDENYLYYHISSNLFNRSYTLDDVKMTPGIIKKAKFNDLITNNMGEIYLELNAQSYNFKSDKSNNIDYVIQSDSIIVNSTGGLNYTIYLNPIFDVEVKLETDFNFFLSFFRRFRYGSFIEDPVSKLNYYSKIEPNCFMRNLEKGKTISQYSNKIDLKVYFSRDLNFPDLLPFNCYIYAWEDFRDVGGIQFINFYNFSKSEKNILNLPLDRSYEEIIREITYRGDDSSNNFSITPVTGLSVNNNRMGSSILLKWDMPNESFSGFAIARSKIVNEQPAVFEIISNNPHSNFAVDYKVEEGNIYEYRVVSYVGDSFNLEKIYNISGIRVEAIEFNSSIEEVVFVLPMEYSDDSVNLNATLNSFINNTNFIYKDTNKKFILSGIKYYNPDSCEVNNCDILNNAEYIEPGALIIYFIPAMLTTGLIDNGVPPTVIIGSESTLLEGIISSNGSEEDSNENIQVVIYSLVHEITHTFGAGFPEYYIYSMGNALDTSGIEPLITNIQLPEEYRFDIMYNNFVQPSDYILSPLTKTIINSNLDHSNLKYLEKQFESSYPSEIKINIQDANNINLKDIEVKIYCMDLVDIRQNSEIPLPVLVENNFTNQSGEVIFELSKIKDSLSAGQCEVIGFKVYKNLSSFVSSYITQT